MKMNKFSKKIYLLCFVLFILFVALQFMYILTPKKYTSEFNVEKYKPKIILLYEVPMWMERIPIVGLDGECIVTSDRNYLPDIGKFDALLFSGSDSWSAKEVFPKVRSSQQYYIFADLESPYFTNHRFSQNSSEEMYNLTMTYRRDSDIYWPYGFISDQKINFVSDLIAPKWMPPNFNNNSTKFLEVVKSKTRTAAWFVSNCHPASMRNELFHVLQQHIDIDIYGKCGNFTCSVKDTDHCYELVEQKYFFYFSFENSLCKDYLTEKVFNVLKYNIVPVVYGGTNYSHYLPPHSYIDANDFVTATELANYLRYLSGNPHEYVKYFWWKYYYKTISTFKTYNNLCKKLHHYTSTPNMGQFTKTYNNISSWFNDGQCTSKSKIKII